MKRSLLLLCFLTALPVLAEQAPTAPAAPPEVQKTVEAFQGTWKIQGKLALSILPQPADVTLNIDCKPTALGKAVLCSAPGQIAGLGPMELGFVVGYSPDEKQVRFMVISSANEFHDHKGVWKDAQTLLFEPLKFVWNGQQAVEDLQFTFQGNNMSFRSVIAKVDGTKDVFEGSGTR